MPRSIDLSAYQNIIEEMIQASSKIITPLYLSPKLKIDTKADKSVVTQADRDTEQKLREIINKHFPNHGIIGEEYGNENDQAEFVWTLDPIDGTIGFTHGIPSFGTMIGLLYQGEPVLGVVYQPIMDILCIGDGHTTTLNQQPVSVTNTRHLSEATLLVCDYFRVGKHQDADKFKQLAEEVKLMRTFGDCYAYVLVASGWADMMLDPTLHIWDLAPLIPIIEGAGGVITDWQGNKSVYANSCVASTPELHPQIIKALNG